MLIIMPKQGFKHTEETKTKISAKNTGKKRSDETKQKMSEAWKYRAPMSEETRKKLSDTQLGRHHSDETKAKMSKSAVIRHQKV